MVKNVKIIRQWFIAIVVAAFAMNILLAFYSRAAGWIDRTEGSTMAIYHPNSSMLHGSEGRGHHKTDARGYVNDTSKLADNYVLAVGASYTQGKEVEDGERYTDLLNSWLGYTDEAYVYNVSQDAYYFPKIAQGFSALVQEFPNADKIIIEINRTDFSDTELKSALEQRKFNEMQTGEKIMSTLSWKKKLNILVKEYSPLFFNANNQFKSIKELSVPKDAAKGGTVDLDSYTESLNDVFSLMTTIYDGEIIILFHPGVSIQEDGSLKIVDKETNDIFRNVCADYDVKFVDMSDKFMQTYEENHELPYGFSNTSIGSGHFSVAGHRMIAEELMDYLEGDK